MFGTNDGKVTAGFFRTGKQLLDDIAAPTEDSRGKYLRRDFVAPLLDFCLDGCYNGKVGLVCGLRATGKTVGLALSEISVAGVAILGEICYNRVSVGDAPFDAVF